MKTKIYSVITGTGSYIPPRVVKNEDFMQNKFFSPSGEPIKKDSSEVIEKFKEITEIEERRYVDDEYVASDIGSFAAQQAIEAAGVDPETLDQIIVAHNFGDVSKETLQTDILPSLASKVKYKLRIQNPFCVAYDIYMDVPAGYRRLFRLIFILNQVLPGGYLLLVPKLYQGCPIHMM